MAAMLNSTGLCWSSAHGLGLSLLNVISLSDESPSQPPWDVEGFMIMLPLPLYLVTIISYSYLFLPKLMMALLLLIHQFSACLLDGDTFQIVFFLVIWSALFSVPTSATLASSMPRWKWGKQRNPVDMRVTDGLETSRFSTDSRFRSLSPSKWEKQHQEVIRKMELVLMWCFLPQNCLLTGLRCFHRKLGSI